MENSLLDDHAIEAFFLGTGQSAWTNDHALRTLADEVVVATGGPPPRPHGALLAFLDEAASAPTVPALVAVPTPAPAPAGRGQHPAAVAPAGTTDRRSTVRLLPRRLRLAAGIAAGIGIAAVTLTVAGTTGVLPDPAMRAMGRLVEAVTPFELSEPGKPSSPGVPAPPPATASSVPVTSDPGPGAVGAVAPSGERPSAITPPAGSPGAVPPNSQAPAQPGSTGLDRAGQTPASQFIPPFVPGGPAGPPSPPTGDGSGPPGPGADRARETPAGTVIPPVAGGRPSRR